MIHRKTFLNINSNTFSNFPFNAENKKALHKATQIRFFRPKEHHTIAGWLTPIERQTLYSLAFSMSGPILEIGAWAGLSTTAIARGVKDSKRLCQFDSIELNPTLNNFKSYQDKVGFFVPGDNLPHGTCTTEFYNKEIRPVLEQDGGVAGVLKRNLEKLKLSQFVNIHFSDFHQIKPSHYNFVFCDALHDEAEIVKNAPHLKKLLNQGAILACHDVGNNPNLIKILKEFIPLGAGTSVDSLYIAEMV